MKNQLGAQPQPFLGYIHLFPPHYPYTTRHDFIDIFDDGWQPVYKPELYFSEGHSNEFLLQERQYYDEFIAYVDAEFGRLYEYMEQSGVLDNTYLIFTSDHGEMFERGIYTHNTPTLYEPVIQIPLLIWAPGKKQSQNIFMPTSCVDVYPTLMRLASQPIPVWCEGRILPPFDRESEKVGRSIFAVEARRNPRHAPLEQVTLVLIKGRYKLVYYLGYGRDVYELFDLENDPEELDDLYYTQRSTARDLRNELAEKLAEVNHPYQ
jgi:arylsulfatase A-like enzyme